MSEKFKTTCFGGLPHQPFNETLSVTICRICSQKIHETKVGWFTEEDSKNWDEAYN